MRFKTYPSTLERNLSVVFLLQPEFLAYIKEMRLIKNKKISQNTTLIENQIAINKTNKIVERIEQIKILLSQNVPEYSIAEVLKMKLKNLKELVAEIKK